VIATAAIALAHACAVCAAADPTVVGAGAEQPYARRLRLDGEVLVGAVSEAAPDGRLLTVSDLRSAVTAAAAPSPDVLLSLAVPLLTRTLSDGGDRTTATVAGDLDARVYDLAWRDGPLPRVRLGIVGGVKLPTAPVQDDARGAPLPVELQPGCSAVVPYFGAALSLGRGFLTGRVDAALFLPFAVRSAPHAGDSLRAGAWVQAQPAEVLAARVGARARLESTGELSTGVPDVDSGGLVGYVTSELLVRPSSDVVVSAGAAFPVVQAWLGVHRETAVASADVAVDF